MSYENSRRFINAFIDIESVLEKTVKSTHHMPFYQLVDTAAQIDPFIQDIAVELKEYADLRNAIVHERIDDRPIAEPHYDVVKRLEKIRDLLESPPIAADYFLRDVVTCELTELLSDAAVKMLKNAFSKLPVYDGQRFVGLLTAEAITYWLADRFLEGEKPFKQEQVSSVLEYIDQPDNHYFITPTCSLFEILRVFDDYRHQGKRLQAILVSSDGSKTGELLGIITNFDLPLIYHIIEGP